MIKNYAIAALALALAACSGTQPKGESAIPKDSDLEARVKEIVGGMSLDDKIGQMCQLSVDGLAPAFNDDGTISLKGELLDTIIGKYRVGSFLNVARHAVTPEQWYGIISQIQDKSMQELGVPTIYGLDQNHGATYTMGATFFPQNLSVAASFNTSIAERAAEITAYETRASNCPWTFSPTLDLGRDPRWPRMYENYGEDAYVNAEMGRAAVRGFQGPDPNHIDENHIAVCLKHFMGYGMPYSGKDRTPAYISPQDVREKHFAPYKAAITEGALSVMVNSASVNGKPLHANAQYLTEWLKHDLNWDGVIVTDWADIDNLWSREKVAKDRKDAIRIAINAGIDMSMDPYNPNFTTLLRELVDEGLVSESRIDDAVSRIIRMKLRLGLFDKPNTIYTDYPKFGCEEFATFAREGAEECIVLLKNDADILPIKAGKRILVTGPNGNSMRSLNGGWSYTWQGESSDFFAEKYNTIYEALSNKYGAANVKYVPGVEYGQGDWRAEKAPDIASAVRAAAWADVIVACIGENSYTETPGNLSNLALSPNQTRLVQELAKTGKPIVLVLNEGRPRLIADIEPLATAVIDAILPGNYGGDALANLMAGDVNFSAKLPFTYPKEINSLITYDHKVSEVYATMEGMYDYSGTASLQWPFGYGLSYTTYEYSNLTASTTDFTAADVITFTVDVANTGNMAGKEAVLLYSTDLVASQVPDARRLRAFDKVALAPGEKTTVKLEVPASSLAFVDWDGKWTLEEGEFRIQAGDQSITINCTATSKWD